MNLSFYIPAAAFSFLGGLAQSIGGFGYGPLNMSILPYLLPYGHAVALAGLCGGTSAVLLCFSGRKHINWKLLIPCETTGIITNIVFAYLSATAPGPVMTRLLGGMLAVLGVYMYFFSSKIHIAPTPRNAALAGALAGIGGGLFAVGGAPMSIYMMAATQDKDEYRATLNAHFCLSSFVNTVTRFSKGIITIPVLQNYAVLLAVMFAGIHIGNKIFRRLNAQHVRNAVCYYLIISGILMMIKTV